MPSTQPHPTSCKTERVLNSGAGVSLDCTNKNRPPCWCYPGSRDWGWLGLHPVIKLSPAHVLALYVPTMHHGYVGVCLILVHVSVIGKVPPDVFQVGNVEPSRTYWCAQELFTALDHFYGLFYSFCKSSQCSKYSSEDRRNAVKLVPKLWLPAKSQEHDINVLGV